MKKKFNLKYDNLRDPKIWHAFFHHVLWLLLPGVAVLAFAVVFLILRLDEHTAAKALSGGFISAGATSFGWILGLWASVQNDPVDDEEEEESSESADWSAQMLVWLILLLLCALIFHREIECLIDGQVALGVARILSKIMVIAALCVPVWLTIHKQKI